MSRESVCRKKKNLQGLRATQKGVKFLKKKKRCQNPGKEKKYLRGTPYNFGHGGQDEIG